jgi:hypothetical protein
MGLSEKLSLSHRPHGRRSRRAVPEDELIILICAVSSNILDWISWLSIKIC